MNRSLTAILISLLTLLNISPTSADNPTFVQRNGNQLYLNGEVFRFAGANIYWLGLDENVRDASGSTLTHPSQYRVDNALQTTHQMGANVVRTFAVLSVGCELCVQPAAGVFNEAAFESFDYALKQAREYDIRFILPLVDNYDYYHGGRSDYANWHGIPADNFYTNPAVIENFKQHISFVLNHVNPHTGLAYKDDPTILAWETGNELQSESAWAYVGWTQEIASHIKSIAPNQLIADGRSALTAYNTPLDASSLALEVVDLVSGHYYPLDFAALEHDLAQARQAGKVFIVGEYDWTDTSGQRAAASFAPESREGHDFAARIDITRASPINHHVQFSYAPLQLNQGQDYHLTFEAKATANRDIVIVIQNASAPFTEHIRQTVSITPDWRPYDIPFTSPVNSSNILLSINMAAAAGQVWLDNFALSDNAIDNTTITQGSTDKLTGWAFTVIGNPDIISLDDFLNRIENLPNVAGSLYWAMFGHDDNYGYVRHNQVYALYYPGSSDIADRVTQLRTHAFRMQHHEVPPYPTPGTPLLHSVSHDLSGIRLMWRGVAGASHYVIERSEDGGLSWVEIASAVSDRAVPFTDSTTSPDRIYQYRVKAVNPSGEAGQFSTPANTAELWANGSFEFRNQEWLLPTQFITSASTQASIMPDTAGHIGRQAALIDITVPGQHSSDIQLRQQNIPLQRGERYSLSFWAKASTAQPIEMVLSGQEANRRSWTYDLTTDWQEYTLEIEASATEQNATLAFLLGRSTGKIWFDGVRVLRVDSTGSLVNR